MTRFFAAHLGGHDHFPRHLQASPRAVQRHGHCPRKQNPRHFLAAGMEDHVKQGFRVENTSTHSVFRCLLYWLNMCAGCSRKSVNVQLTSLDITSETPEGRSATFGVQGFVFFFHPFFCFSFFFSFLGCSNSDFFFCLNCCTISCDFFSKKKKQIFEPSQVPLGGLFFFFVSFL